MIHDMTFPLYILKETTYRAWL